MKSSTSFKVLPVSLAQVFLLECNLRFSSIKSFEKVSDILSICAAATSPMNCTQIFHTINALKPEKILWQEFASRYEFLKSAYVYHSSIIKINIVSYAGYLIYVDLQLYRFNTLAGFLIRRADDTVMFYHQTFKEWLIGNRNLNENGGRKFLCDIRTGHLAIALKLCRQEQELLNPETTLELANNILKSQIYKDG